MSLIVNVAAAAVFIAIADLDYAVVLVMAVTSLVGGVIGGSVAARVSARALRVIVMIAGSAVAAVYLVKLI